MWEVATAGGTTDGAGTGDARRDTVTGAARVTREIDLGQLITELLTRSTTPPEPSRGPGRQVTSRGTFPRFHAWHGS